MTVTGFNCHRLPLLLSLLSLLFVVHILFFLFLQSSLVSNEYIFCWKHHRLAVMLYKKRKKRRGDDKIVKSIWVTNMSLISNGFYTLNLKILWWIYADHNAASDTITADRMIAWSSYDYIWFMIWLHKLDDHSISILISYKRKRVSFEREAKNEPSFYE